MGRTQATSGVEACCVLQYHGNIIKVLKCECREKTEGKATWKVLGGERGGIERRKNKIADEEGREEGGGD